MDLRDATRIAAAKLRDSRLAEPLREAASLVSFAISRDRAFLIAHPDYELTPEENVLFTRSLARRANREPLQYITGRQEFYGLEFEVSPAVLIPRPETEILVEKAIELLSGIDNPAFIELGVGSGCISVSVLHSIPKARSVGVDISPAAIEIASANARKHVVADRFEIIESDLFENVNERKFDLILSNPPYIPNGEIPSLQAEVRDYEPVTALAGGAGGLDIVGRIAIDAPRFLRQNGGLLVEIGYGQSDEVAEIFNTPMWKSPIFLPDLQQIPRVLFVKAR